MTTARLRILGVLAALALCGGWDWFVAPDRQVESGNDHFRAGRYEQALAAYRSALQRQASPALRFDEGAALYQLAIGSADAEARDRLLDEAETAFRRAAEAADPVLKSSAYYNLGNTLFQRERYDEAADAYKKALRANQHNDDARYNLELTQRRRRQEGSAAAGPGLPQPGQGGGDEGEGGGEGARQPDQDGPAGGSPEGSGEPQGGAEQTTEPGGADADGERAEPQADPGTDPSGDAPDAPEAPDPELPPEPPADAPGADRSPSGKSPREPKAEVDRKLDALERMSRELRRRNLRGGASETHRSSSNKDW